MQPQPNLSDEQFASLMPDLDPALVIKVRQVMVQVSGWDSEEIHPDTRLVEFEI